MGEVAFELGLDAGSLGPLAEFSARLADLTPVMDEAGYLMLSSVFNNFAAQGRPEKWLPLASSTVERKGHGTILFETGHLMSSIDYGAGPDRLEVMAHVPYAGIQQDGGRAGVHMISTIPARPFLFFQHEDVQIITGMVEEYLAGVF